MYASKVTLGALKVAKALARAPLHCPMRHRVQARYEVKTEADREGGLISLLRSFKPR
jgi:hypothetical protein